MPVSLHVCGGPQPQADVPLDQLPLLLTPSVPGKAPATNGNSKTALWVDINDPAEDDWKMLEDRFNFHSLAIEDAQNQNQRAKLDAYNGYLFLSVRAWSPPVQPIGVENSQTAADVEQPDDMTQEIDMFLGPQYLVTVHTTTIPAVAETRRRATRLPEGTANSAAHLMHLLLDAIVDDYFPAMDAIDADMDELEAQVYEASGGTNAIDMKPALKLKKRLLVLRQAVTPMRDVLNQFLRTDDPSLLPPELRVFYQDVYDHTLRLSEQIDLHRDILNGIMDAIMAQSSNRLNQVVKTMTGVSTVLMTVTLISSIYGMNFENMPELHWRYGYFLALGTMATVGLSVAAFFKRIGWF